MEIRDLSKLQIRAEVILILQNLCSLPEISREVENQTTNKLRSIKDMDYVLEVLAKELQKSDYRKGQIIANFLQELGNLSTLQEILWSYIKSPTSSDELKDLSSVILKNLGDQTDPEEFLNYLEDPKAVVDKETQKLLEVASINPEAQIDFLDFLFSLPEQEQINLVTSLKEDYSSENLVNIIVPALESHCSQKLEEELVKILGETRSLLAVAPLQDVVKYSQNEFLKKYAQKSLKMLKLAGIDIEEKNSTLYRSKITLSSEIYECHSNFVDGVGNQGFIISRIKPNFDILMLNIVINDIHGIIDCFGFYGISKKDFKRIVEKFQETSTRIQIPPEYCKYRLLQAEKINKQNNMPIPYEYASWKSLVSDIEPLCIDFSELAKQWVDKELINETSLLYKFPDFKHWFIEEDDTKKINAIFEKLISEIIENKQKFLKNKSELTKWTENSINLIFDTVFDDEYKNIYKNRMLDIMYLLNVQELPLFRNIAASLAWAITPENSYNIKTIPFFKEIVRKTISECLIRYQYQLNNPSEALEGIRKKEPETQIKISSEKDITEILELLFSTEKTSL